LANNEGLQENSILWKNKCILRKYDEKHYKVVYFKRNGFIRDDDYAIIKGSLNDEKLDNNIFRAKSKVLEYALCNPWDYFSTFTINPDKFDRKNLKAYQKAFGQWLRDYNKKYKLNIKYLTIPEEHKKGGWHEHGFIYGLPLEHLRLFTIDEKLPDKLRAKIIKGDIVYDWTAYREKFGFVDFEPIRNQAAASRYVTKYISKGILNTVKEVNAHLYYCSKGLKLSEIIKIGTPTAIGIPETWFGNDYIKTFWINDGAIEKLDTIIAWDEMKDNT